MTGAFFSPSLGWLLTALAGAGMEVDRSLRTLRPVLTGQHLLLPEAGYATQRAAVAHAAGHLLFSPPALRPTGLKPMSIAVISAVEDARVDSLMLRHYPGMRQWIVPALRAAAQRDGLSFGALISRMSLALIDDTAQDDNHWVNKARQLFATLSDRLHDYTAFRQFASVLANDLGQMRVRFDLNSYVVPVSYRDDNTYLWEFGVSDTGQDESPLELSEDAHPTPPPDASQDPSPKEVGAGQPVIMYPEWDCRLERLRENWCSVVDQPCGLQAVETAPTAAPRIDRAIGGIALPLTSQLARHQRLRRQLEGETLDLDAAIAMMIDRKLGLRPDPRLYVRPGRDVPRVSLLLLIDVSASTNDVVAGSRHSVLDMEKSASIQLASAAIARGHRVAVHGFSSDTRACVNYFRLLDFGQPMDAAAERSILSLRGRFSTRIGAAIRHATTYLQTERDARRAILVVTDGAPSDIDVFDPQYLLHDAREAVLDGRRAGIRTCGVVVDRGAATYARTIFGRGNYCIADTAGVLPGQLSAIYARIVAN
ncbi:hypothetical protein LMG18090_00813 [Ralstonia mannitolilytica]|uniref:VWA domain-containing protein n=1 Tax=Ralstonia TaxID=48736 RepID=UPI000469FA8D|nr:MULTISPECIES: VWA domain-containing protein [Ralstonia]CAJ0777406.1 hypothetical protein LMG18090_00813 [Ralstonia mannitolilytica]CAJ0895463.1 hypothetical protein R6138_03899 [Ralstonia sp. LMG 18095]